MNIILDPYCQTQINNCLNNACANNASCINGINSYACSCPAGFTGQYCQISLNPCQNSPCTNGLCIPTPASPIGYFCNCYPGWTGPTCGTVLNNW